MKRSFHETASFVRLIMLFLFSANLSMQAQQSNTLFFMHALPESNYINPAVQTECGIFIGLPLISSFHTNIANSGFTASKYLTLYTDGSVRRNFDFDTDKMPRKNYALGEFHSVLLAFGLKRNRLYYSFTISEKDHNTLIYTRDMMAFSLRGGAPFEGRSIDLEGTSYTFNHYREYAFGVSKQYNDRFTFGIKVKLLFGKYNLTTSKSDFRLYIEPGTQDVIFDLNGGFYSSMPYSLQEENPGSLRFTDYYDATLSNQLTNRKNPGFAVDLGFIYKYSEKITLSGSLLDAGMIFYRSNLTHYSISGSYDYQGEFGDGPIQGDGLWDLFDELNANMTEETGAEPYTYYLDPKLYLGMAYKMNRKYDINLLTYNRIHRGKWQTGVTASVLTRPTERLVTSVSWSYINNSATNLGVGIGYGKSPLQFYLVSDNIIGFIWPMSVKNVNLRLGVNLNLSCREAFNIDACGCSWMKKAEDRQLRKKKFRQGKN